MGCGSNAPITLMQNRFDERPVHPFAATARTVLLVLGSLAAAFVLGIAKAVSKATKDRE